MTNEQFAEYYPRYEDVIHAIARKFAKQELDLLDDLVSAGTLGLLGANLDNAKRNPDAWLRKVIRNKMVDHMRWLNRRQFDSIEPYIHQGYDVALDDEGVPELVFQENMDPELVVVQLDEED